MDMQGKINNMSLASQQLSELFFKSAAEMAKNHNLGSQESMCLLTVFLSKIVSRAFETAKTNNDIVGFVNLINIKDVIVNNLNSLSAEELKAIEEMHNEMTEVIKNLERG